jgi:hypothetical protein
MINKPESETAIIRSALRVIDERLPPSWTLAQTPDACARQAGPSPDAEALLTGPDGKSVRIAIKAKRVLEPRGVDLVFDALRRRNDRVFLIVAPYLSTRTRQLLREKQCSFADSTGNVWLSIPRPAVFIETMGATKDLTRTEQPLRTLRGRGTSKAVPALCDFRPPYGVRELAKRAGISAPTLSRVIDFLDREALLKKDERAVVQEIDWAGTIRRWTQDYAFSKSNRVATFLEPRGLSDLRLKLSKAKWTYAATGSLAASLVAPIVATRLAQLYVRDIEAAADALELKRAEAGANVMLAEPFDDVVYDRTSRRDGLLCAALTQVAADLLTSPGRGPAEAEELLQWMKANDAVWRT